MNKEVSKCYRSIESAKKRLIRKVNKLGYLWEDFGQDEVRKLKDKYFLIHNLNHDDVMDIEEAIQSFSIWCQNYKPAGYAYE